MSTATPTICGDIARSAGRAPADRRPRSRVLRRYRDEDGVTRELIARPAANGTVLVIDRDLLDGGEERLIAHLAFDEPPRNALLAVEQYLAAEPCARRCRAVEPSDSIAAPFPAPSQEALRDVHGTDPVDGSTCAFRLRRVPSGMSIPALRWTRRGDASDTETVSLREAIATLESYEPLRSITGAALHRYERDPTVSCTVLRAELTRVLDSAIVLNRGLREAVVEKVSAGGASMSE
ncbi:MAG: hypothetical protein JWM60_2063, partial [Solirubrobacterales bacterium]|nr:hypothetical protein [Solirubrobacterales bacterium]